MTKLHKVELRAEVDTAACQHGQDDGSEEYFLLTIYVEINGVPRHLRFRTSESSYPGNDAMLPVLQEVVRRINA